MDSISAYRVQDIKGHRMEGLVAAILQAKGYAVYRSSKGADRDVDLLASYGELGFGGTKVCLQVKSHDAPVDRLVMDQLERLC